MSPASKKTSNKKTANNKPGKKKMAKKKVAVKKSSNKTPAKKQSVKKQTVKPKASKKKSAKTPSHPSELSVSPEERWKMIAVAAYLKAEKRGFSPGYEFDDWNQAEKEIDALLNG